MQLYYLDPFFKCMYFLDPFFKCMYFLDPFIFMHVFLSYVLSLICEAVLCLELVFAELGQAHYK